MVPRYEQLDVREREAMRELAKLAKLVKASWSSLQDLIGIATRSASALLVEVGDARRFTKGASRVPTVLRRYRRRREKATTSSASMVGSEGINTPNRGIPAPLGLGAGDEAGCPRRVQRECLNSILDGKLWCE